MQLFRGKLEGDRAANQSAANDDDVVSAHGNILSGILARIFPDAELAERSGSVMRTNARSAYRESTSSTERRRAFWARVWARDQSPALPASSDWARKLRIFSCRSCWAAFRTLPLACLRFFCATSASTPVLRRMLA